MESDNSTSGFIFQDSQGMDRQFTDRTEIQTAGFNRLVRAKRYGKWYMLKGLKPEYSSQELYRQLLRKEFDVSVMLSHQNIVQTIGWEYVDGIGECIIFEYIDGQTLKDFLETNPSQTVRKKIATELLSAMEYVNGMQAVHRDLKPANIMVSKNGTNLKLIDFGLSDTDSYNILKQPAGTEKYMSPEQKLSSVPDCRNDIYSIGKVLLEINAGWAYNAVARRCCREIEKRYRNVGQVRDAIKFREKFMQAFSVTIIAAIFILLLVYAFVVQQRKISISLPAVHDTVYVAGGTDTVVLKNTYAPSSDRTDTIVTYVVNDNEQVNNIIEGGKRQVDKMLRPFEELVRTTKVHTFKFDSILGMMINQYNDRLISVADSLTAGMDNSSEGLVRNTIYTYSGKRWNELYPSILEIQTRELGK